jgi:hypothetical protein
MKKANANRKTTPLRISGEAHGKLLRAAEGTGLSLNQIMETALAHMLHEYERTGSIRVMRIKVDGDTSNKKPDTTSHTDEARVKRLLE